MVLMWCELHRSFPTWQIDCFPGHANICVICSFWQQSIEKAIERVKENDQSTSDSRLVSLLCSPFPFFFACKSIETALFFTILYVVLIDQKQQLNQPLESKSVVTVTGTNLNLIRSAPKLFRHLLTFDFFL